MRDRIFLLAGEASGDLHGAALLEHLHLAFPTSILEGVGGPRMRQTDFSCVIPMEEFQVMGLTDVFRALPQLLRHMTTLVSHILLAQPRLVLLIDYPGFNLRLAKKLRKKGFRGKIVQYISPKVWAWGAKRIEQMAEHLDLLLTIFPFEKNMFAHTKLPVEYVGHPLIERIHHHPYQTDWKQKVGLPDTPFISLFPGSRPAELRRNGPLLMQTAEQYSRAYPDMSLAISYGQDSLKESLETLLASSPLADHPALHLVPSTYNYEMMKDAHLALAKSGTVTVELALHRTPTVVFYVVNPLNRWLVRFFIRPKLSHFCMVNILRQKEVFPEWIVKPFTSEDLVHSLSQMHQDDIRATCQDECQRLMEEMGDPNHSQQVIDALQRIL